MALMAKARVERVGRGATGACIALVALLVVTLVAMVAGRGIATFTADGIDLGSFLTGTRIRRTRAACPWWARFP